MIAEGTYKAIVTGCYVGESAEKKTPFFSIEFKLENGSYIDNVFYLSKTEYEKNHKTTNVAKESLRTLAELGFQGKSLLDMAKEDMGISDLFVPVADISVVVFHEEYEKDGEQNFAAKVKYVNIGTRQVNKLDHKQAVVKFKGTSFDGILMGLKKETDLVIATESAQTDFAADDIPF